MTPDPLSPDAIDPGQPIAVLKELQRETSTRFADKVRGRIHRRTATSQLTTYSWEMPQTTLLEMVRLLVHFFQSFGVRKEP